MVRMNQNTLLTAAQRPDETSNVHCGSLELLSLLPVLDYRQPKNAATDSAPFPNPFHWSEERCCIAGIERPRLPFDYSKTDRGPSATIT
jgi:hypothetical protein